MIYSKLNLADGDEITTRAMNHIESIAASSLSDVVTHHHNTVYLTKILADDNYWSTENGVDCDADMLQGIHASEGLLGIGKAFPIGTIAMWEDALANLPPGWQLADGTNGTQDMRNVFPVGTSSTHVLGATFGANTVTPSSTITVLGHALSIYEIPTHHHYVLEKYHSSGTSFQSVYATGTLDGHEYLPTGMITTTNPAGGNAPHSHTGTWSGGSVSNLPPYFALYLIEKVS